MRKAYCGISRVTANEDYISIEIRVEGERVPYKVYMTPHDFAYAITGRGDTPAKVNDTFFARKAQP